MIHVGAEPPWRGYSRWYGEWTRLPEDWFGDTRWAWQSPSTPKSFVAVLARELDAIRGDLREQLSKPTILLQTYNLAELHKNVQVTG